MKKLPTFPETGSVPKRRSEAYWIALLLTLSGGLQDAYTYSFRGKVFANAQTGNVVLLSANLLRGAWGEALHDLVPLGAFVLGTMAAVWIGSPASRLRLFSGEHLILLLEAGILFYVGFIPAGANDAANALVSFSCAMQVQTFRRMRGNPYASTMCIGNLRSGTESFCLYIRTKERKHLQAALQYGGVILCFAVGAGIGSAASQIVGAAAIWLSNLCLLAVFLFCLLDYRRTDL